MVKTSTTSSITIPLIYVFINDYQKSPIKDAELCIEKYNLYFTHKWRVRFSELSTSCIEDIHKILEAYEHKSMTNHADAQILPDNLTFETENGKVFECMLQNSMNHDPPRIRQSREREVIRFLTKFIKLYERREEKMRKQAQLEEIEEEDRKWESNQFRNERSRGRATLDRRLGLNQRNPIRGTKGVYGKRSTSSNSTSSRFFPSKKDELNYSDMDGNANADLDTNADAGVGAYEDVHEGYESRPAFSHKRKRTKAKTKIEKLKDKILQKTLQGGYESFSDEEQEKKQQEKIPNMDPVEQSQQEEEKEEAPAEEKDNEDVPVPMAKGKKRVLVSVGKRLKKKVRIEEDDEDSDVEFDHSNDANGISGSATAFDDEDDDDDEEDIQNITRQKPTTTVTETFKRKPSTVTPTRNLISGTKTEPSSILDGAITDEEIIDDEENNAKHSSPLVTKPSKNGIKSFFGKSNTTNTATQKPKFTNTIPPKTMLADTALNTRSPIRKARKSIPQKLSPIKKIGSSFTVLKTTGTDMVSSPPKIPVKNPYKKTTPPFNGHIGLTNLGNTCYLNSSLQVLFSVPGFLTDLSATYDNLKSSVAEGEEHDVEGETMPLCSALLTVASRLRLIPPRNKKDSTKEGPAFPSILKTEMDKITDKFKGYEQRDAHEFLSDLIDLLHEELEVAKAGHGEYSTELPTDKYFRLDVNVCLTCDACKYSRCKEELYRHLSVDIGENKNGTPWTVDQGLEQFFRPEKRDIKCEKCKEGLSATQTITIKSRPKALLLHVKRFIVEVNEGEVSWRKSVAKVKSDNTVTLQKFSGDKNEGDKNQGYCLQGVVRHIGKDAVSGHYTADAKRKLSSEQKEQWVNFDDTASTLTSIDNILSNERSQQNNYMMIYGR